MTTISTSPQDAWPLNGRKQRLVPDPVTGEPVPYQRVSTFAKTLSDSQGLGAWLAWMAVRGTQAEEGGRLMQQVLHAERTPKGLIDALAELGGSREAAERGSRRHQVVAMALAGVDMTGLPAEARTELDAILDLIHGLGTITAVEASTVNDELRTAGSMDLAIRQPDGTNFILDLKTGSRVNGLEACLQLAAHARSRYWIEGARGDWVSKSRPRLGIIHAPQNGGTPRLIEYDPDAAKRAALLAVQVRELRKELK